MVVVAGEISDLLGQSCCRLLIAVVLPPSATCSASCLAPAFFGSVCCVAPACAAADTCSSSVARSSSGPFMAASNSRLLLGACSPFCWAQMEPDEEEADEAQDDDEADDDEDDLLAVISATRIGGFLSR